MVRTARRRLLGEVSLRRAAERRSMRILMLVKNDLLGNLGVSRPSSVIAAGCQALTALIVTARSIRSAVQRLRRFTWQPGFRIQCQSGTCSVWVIAFTGTVVRGGPGC